MLGFFIAQFSGKFAMRPYIVRVIKAYGSPISPNKATVSFAQDFFRFDVFAIDFCVFQVYLGVVGIIATIISVCMVRIVGKRKLFLTALSVECGVCFALGKRFN